MKLKHFTTILFVLLASFLYAKDVKTMVAVSADGDKTSYALAEIQRIEVNSTDKTASMSILLKDGTIEGSYQKLLFAEKETSIEELGEISLFVYPNPVSNILNVKGVDETASLSVYNLSGKCVLQEKGTEIDVTSLLQGTYILRIDNQYVKFIKK